MVVEFKETVFSRHHKGRSTQIHKDCDSMKKPSPVQTKKNINVEKGKWTQCPTPKKGNYFKLTSSGKKNK